MSGEDRAPSWTDKEGRGVRKPVKACRPVALAQGIPGFADLWATEVPSELVTREGKFLVVSSPCGEHVEVVAGRVVYCPDDCGRWFMRVGDGVRVKRWPREQAIAA